jgi:hypothetical protein
MKKVYVLIGFIAAFSIFILGTNVVLADESFGLNKTAESAGLVKYGNDVPTIAGNIIGTLLSMISVLFFVLVLYGGILWMTARGSSETTEKALNTIIAATIGIIIVIGAYALTNFVFKLGANTGGPSPSAPKVIACCIQNGGNTCKVLPSGTTDDSDILTEPPYECIDTSESACSDVTQCTTIQQ